MINKKQYLYHPDRIFRIFSLFPEERVKKQSGFRGKKLVRKSDDTFAFLPGKARNPVYLLIPSNSFACAYIPPI
jgi:hypothetical protein